MTRREGGKVVQGIQTAINENQKEIDSLDFSRLEKPHGQVLQDLHPKRECIQITGERNSVNLQSFKVESCNKSVVIKKPLCISEEYQSKQLKSDLEGRALSATHTASITARINIMDRSLNNESAEHSQGIDKTSIHNKEDKSLKKGQVSEALDRDGESAEHATDAIDHEVDVIGDNGIISSDKSFFDLINRKTMGASPAITNINGKTCLNIQLANKDSSVTDKNTCQILETVSTGRQECEKNSEKLDSKECQRLENQYPGKECNGTKDNLTGNSEALSSDLTSKSVGEQDNIMNDLDISLPMDEDMECDEDECNRFYFESDNLALKGNEHYHLLLQTLVALESQRVQSIKDLEMLEIKQKVALEDPIGFVEKLQNNEPLGIPTRQAVVKLPQIPWGEYVASLDSLDRHCLPYQHQTRKTSQQLEKSLLCRQELESAEINTANAASDQQRSNFTSMGGSAYGLFGGDFTIDSQRSSLDRDSFVAGCARDFQRETKYVRGRPYDNTKPATFNQPWTVEEQAKLERLLQIYPQEDVESKRWEKIAKALGNRTTKQVASRVQKYFIKLAKASLPVPGRMPNVPKLGVRSRRSSHYQTLSFRNSTFFPNYQPRVYMDDDQDQDTASTAWSDDVASVNLSDDELVPEDLKDSDDYKELLRLKKLKRLKLQKEEFGDKPTIHQEFMCDGCGLNPIHGTRWHCVECPRESSVDFCSDCVQRTICETKMHKRSHKLEAINRAPSYFMDGDYLGLGGTSNDYNYLDPNFLPAAS